MKTRLVILLLCACFHFSCSEFLNLKPDNQQVVYTMEDVKVSMSAYLRAMCSPDQYTLQYNTDWLSFPFSKRPCANFVMYSDDIVMTKAVDNAYSRIYEDNYWEDLNWEGRTFAETFWKCAYLNIGYLNNVLHDLENADDKYEDMDEYEQISGEARVFRAYYVFKLLQLFAPYKDNELGIPVNFDFEKVEGEGRMSQSEVYDLIIRELNDVLGYKAVADNWNGLYSPDVIKAFLAEVYWFKAQSGAAEDTDWENAAKYSGELMERYQPISTTEGYLEVFEAERTAPGSFVKNSTRALVLFSMYSNLYSFYNDFLIHPHLQRTSHNHSVKPQNHHHTQSHYLYYMVDRYKSFSLYSYMTFVIISRLPNYHLQYIDSVYYPNPRYPLPPDAKSL